MLAGLEMGSEADLSLDRRVVVTISSREDRRRCLAVCRARRVCWGCLLVVLEPKRDRNPPSAELFPDIELLDSCARII